LQACPRESRQAPSHGSAKVRLALNEFV
jgi:hypothetical protein